MFVHKIANLPHICMAWCMVKAWGTTSPSPFHTDDKRGVIAWWLCICIAVFSAFFIALYITSLLLFRVPVYSLCSINCNRINVERSPNSVIINIWMLPLCIGVSIQWSVCAIFSFQNVLFVQCFGMCAYALSWTHFCQINHTIGTQKCSLAWPWLLRLT